VAAAAQLEDRARPPDFEGRGGTTDRCSLCERAAAPPSRAAFTITWTFLTVLWFMQILPKHMAAMNSDRYLERTRKLLFPMVEIVRQSGVHKPAVWAATAVERRLDWNAAAAPGIADEETTACSGEP
jgi:hypothetical protein